MIGGLDQGTYYLKEIKAPEGYRQLLDPIEIEIKPTFVADRNKYTAQGEGLLDLSANAKIKTFYSGLFSEEAKDLLVDVAQTKIGLSIVNKAGILLPYTGSYLTLGMIVLDVGCLFSLTKRSRSMKKNNVFWRFVFGAGVVCAFLPLMGAWKEGIRANESIQGYEKTVESLNEASIDENWQLLEAYNESLRSNLSWIEYEKVKERFCPPILLGICRFLRSKYGCRFFRERRRAFKRGRRSCGEKFASCWGRFESSAVDRA